jgi:hypothetical protein
VSTDPNQNKPFSIENQNIDLFSYKAQKPIYIDTGNPNIGKKYITKTIPHLALTDTKSGILKNWLGSKTVSKIVISKQVKKTSAVNMKRYQQHIKLYFLLIHHLRKNK